MRSTLKRFLILFLLFFAGLKGTSQAGQQIYLSESPNARYRVVIDQVIDRRVETFPDKFFYRYIISLVNVRNPKHHFEILQGGSPLVKETEKHTFQVHWESIHFDWAKDSLKFFVNLEVIEGTWKTYFVDINTGKTADITPDIESAMMNKIDSRGWDCEQPKIEVVSWTKPHLAFIHLTSICGKERGKENNNLFYLKDSVLFDALQVKVVSECMDCKDEKSLKVFDKYFISSIPTPTPTPEETPTAQ
jgi:hypothetical protein